MEPGLAPSVRLRLRTGFELRSGEVALDPARTKASAGQSFLFSPPPLRIPRTLKPLEDQKLNDAAPGTESTEGE